MTITMLSATLLAAEVLFNGYKIPNTSSYYGKNWLENNGKNAANYGGYGTACDLSYWGDGSAFSPDNDYYVKSGRIATIGASGSTELLAPNLHLGIKDNTAGWMMFQTPSTVTLPEVSVGFGGFIVYGTANGQATVSSPKITVDCSSGNPVEIKNYYSPAQSVKFQAPFYGPATSVLKVNQWFNDKGTQGAYTYFAGDMSNYLGLIDVGGYHRLVLDSNSKVSRLNLSENSTLWFGSTQYNWYEDVGIDDLTVGKGVLLQLAISDADTGSLTVGTSLTVPQGTKLPLQAFVAGANYPIYCTTGSTRTIVDLPAGLGKASDVVEIKNSNNAAGFAYMTFTDETSEDRSLLKVTTHKRTNLEKDAAWGTSSLATKSCWNNVGADESLEDYMLIAKNIDGKSNSVRLRFGTSSTDTEVFNGSLVLGDEIYVVQYCHEEIADLRLLPGSYWQFIKNWTSQPELNGTITVYDIGNLGADGYPTKANRFYLSNENQATMTVKIGAAFKGRGYVAFQPPANNTAPSGSFVLDGDNSAYAGRFGVMHVNANRTMTLQVSSANNLGGALDGYLKDAIKVGNCGILEATESFKLEEPTRGLYVDNGGTVKVDETKTMSVASPMMLKGAVTKSGPGTLDLCGTVTPEGTSAPVMTVSEGTLRVSAGATFSGCEVVFGDGASLGVDGDSTDAEYLAKGVDLANLTLTTGDSLLVKVESAQSSRPERMVALVTDTTDKAAALAAKIVAKLVLADGRARRCAVSCVPNADGMTSTVYADCRTQGLMLLLR